MQQSDISELLTTSPAVQMIRMRNAHWVLPFLYQTFKSENRLSIPEPVLTSVLAEELRTHAEGTEDLEEARIEFGEDEESRARKYLLNWVQKRLLQDFPDADAVTQYQLSSHYGKSFPVAAEPREKTIRGNGKPLPFSIPDPERNGGIHGRQ